MSNHFIRCPNAPAVLVQAIALPFGIAVTHSGIEQDLIAAGVVTAEMFAARTGTDANGMKFHVMRPFSRRKGRTVQRYWVFRSELSLDNALRLLGVRRALDIRAERGRRLQPPVLRPAGHLRLVVDNTRKVRT